MFGILLLLICPLCGDPEEIRPAVGQTSPAPRLLTPNPNHANEPGLLAETRRIHSLLQGWETASNNQDERSTSARQSLRLNATRELNGHAALAVEQLSGRVRASQLEEQFSWALVEDSKDLVCLEARPKDETEHLFYGSICVWLDSKTSQSIKLHATDRQGEVRTSWLANPQERDPELIRVAYVPSAEQPDNAIPPSPAILNQQGLSAVVSILASSIPVPRFGPQIDTSPDPTDLSPVTPELAQILDKCEAASRDTKTVQLRFSRTIYYLVFEVEKCADGEMFYDAPHKFSTVLRPDNGHAAKVAAKKRIGTSGKPFRIEADHPETYIATATEALWINDEEKTYQRVPLPNGISSQQEFFWIPDYRQFWRSAFLLDIRADQVRKEWSLKYVRSKNDTVIITARPRTSALKNRCSECWIMIDAKTWQTVAVKLFDSSGNLETVYKVNERKMNPTLPDDCFTPQFESRGYRNVSERRK
jgi:hypothetical protein